MRTLHLISALYVHIPSFPPTARSLSSLRIESDKTPGFGTLSRETVIASDKEHSAISLPGEPHTQERREGTTAMDMTTSHRGSEGKLGSWKARTSEMIWRVPLSYTQRCPDSYPTTHLDVQEPLQVITIPRVFCCEMKEWGFLSRTSSKSIYVIGKHDAYRVVLSGNKENGRVVGGDGSLHVREWRALTGSFFFHRWVCDSMNLDASFTSMTTHHDSALPLRKCWSIV